MSHRLARAVAAYARRFHAAALVTGPAHHVASPLGAWLVLALAADGTDGSAREEAAAVLGLPVHDAVTATRALLAHPHPAVAAAVACWSAPQELGDRLRRWVAGLPADADTGPVPDQAGADRWAAERTDGLVERFPVAVDPSTVLVLASALATRVAWARPFEAVEAADLGGPWSGGVDRVLTQGRLTHLADTDTAGLVAVTVARSTTLLDVVTVVAAADVAPEDVLEAAHQLAIDPASGRRSLFDVPLGPGHSWDLDEVVEQRPSPVERVEEATVVLPAWTASSTHPLLADERFGFGAVARHLLAALPHRTEGWEADAAQAAVATYGRVGFEAAAVTAMAMRAGAALPTVRRVTRRTLTARVTRPHAVVAVARDADGDGEWHGLPVFSAWVTEPSEVDD